MLFAVTISWSAALTVKPTRIQPLLWTARSPGECVTTHSISTVFHDGWSNVQYVLWIIESGSSKSMANKVKAMRWWEGDGGELEWMGETLFFLFILQCYHYYYYFILFYFILFYFILFSSHSTILLRDLHFQNRLCEPCTWPVRLAHGYRRSYSIMLFPKASDICGD